MVERALGVQLASVDHLLDRTEVHLGIILGEDVVEAALRQPHVERHLAALEAGDADAGTRLGALLAAAGGLAEPRANATAYANARLARALVVTDFVEFHVPALAFALFAQLPKERFGLGVLFDAEKVMDLADLPHHFRRRLDLHRTVKLVEAEADERRPLRLVAADRRAGLCDLDLRHHFLLRDRFGLGLSLGSAGATAAEQVGDLLATAL